MHTQARTHTPLTPGPNHNPKQCTVAIATNGELATRAVVNMGIFPSIALSRQTLVGQGGASVGDGDGALPEPKEHFFLFVQTNPCVDAASLNDGFSDVNDGVSSCSFDYSDDTGRLPICPLVSVDGWNTFM